MTNLYSKSMDVLNENANYNRPGLANQESLENSRWADLEFGARESVFSHGIHDGAEHGPACHFSFFPELVFHQQHSVLSSDANALLSVSS